MRLFPMVVVLFFVLVSSFVAGAALRGTIYDSHLDVETNVLVEIDTIPQQQFLAANGTYTFLLPPGNYTLRALKGDVQVQERILIRDEGDFVFDLFLLPEFLEEDELWQETEEEYFNDEPSSRWWAYAIAGLIALFGIYRFVRMRKKYGSLWKFRRKKQVEARKTLEEHKADLEKEPGYIDEVVAVIQKHEGRISQKELRREMLHLSEAKISLILTELEHKGKIEKVKKGRGNVLLMK